MSLTACTVCGSTADNRDNLLLTCKGCRRKYHHKCHQPALSSADLATLIRQYHHSTAERKSLNWKCRQCAEPTVMYLDSDDSDVQEVPDISRKRARNSKEVWPQKRISSTRHEEIVLSDSEDDILPMPEASSSTHSFPPASRSCSASMIDVEIVTASSRNLHLPPLRHDSSSEAAATSPVPAPIPREPETLAMDVDETPMAASQVQPPRVTPMTTVMNGIVLKEEKNAMEIKQEPIHEPSLKTVSYIVSKWLQPHPPPRPIHASRRPGKAALKHRAPHVDIQFHSSQWTTGPPRL